MEKILQYAWKWRMYGNENHRLVDGRTVCILDPGTLNTGSGPDFFNAKIMCDGFVWAGNVELHMRASDWWKHNHHLDEAYSNVILHVVAVDDARLTRKDGTEIPQLLFPLTPQMSELYVRLTTDASKPPPLRCWYKLSQIPKLLVTDAVSTAACERLAQKAQRITDTLRRLDGDMAHTCLVTLARALGFGTNAEPFERTALALNLNHCARHADNQDQIDAIIFGQAGLLDEAQWSQEQYPHMLASEFRFLAHKYRITSLPRSIWKRSGMRPANFPHRRLAYLARLIPDCHSLLSRILACGGDIDALKSMLITQFDGYWSCHYNFGKPQSKQMPEALSDSSLRLLLINAIAPLCHAFGQIQGDSRLRDTAIDILENLPPENNSLIRDWERVGIKPNDALSSQGLLQLRKMYCDRNECLHCRIGNRLMRSEALPALPVAAETH